MHATGNPGCLDDFLKSWKSVRRDSRRNVETLGTSRRERLVLLTRPKPRKAGGDRPCAKDRI